MTGRARGRMPRRWGYPGGGLPVDRPGIRLVDRPLGDGNWAPASTFSSRRWTWWASPSTRTGILHHAGVQAAPAPCGSSRRPGRARPDVRARRPGRRHRPWRPAPCRCPGARAPAAGLSRLRRLSSPGLVQCRVAGREPLLDQGAQGQGAQSRFGDRVGGDAKAVERQVADRGRAASSGPASWPAAGATSTVRANVVSFAPDSVAQSPSIRASRSGRGCSCHALAGSQAPEYRPGDCSHEKCVADCRSEPHREQTVRGTQVHGLGKGLGEMRESVASST